MFEVSEEQPDGSFLKLGYFTDDGTPITREAYLAAARPTHSVIEFMAQMCPPGSSERAALRDFWVARLVQLTERRLAAQAAERAELVGLLAAQRPAPDDLPPDHPGAAGPDTRTARVPELMDVSEWLPCELGMLHPYGQWEADHLAATSLRLTGRFTATLQALRAGQIDYERARRLTDLLAPLEQGLGTRVEALVLPKAPGQTPQQLAASTRRTIDRIDAAARIRRHDQARAAADVTWWPTEDGMARLAADLPLPAAAACGNAVDAWAWQQRAGGDTRPIGAIRADVLSDLILRPWAERPTISANVMVHVPWSTLTDPTQPATHTGYAPGSGGEPGEVDGHSVSAEQCRRLLEELDALGLQRPDCGTLAIAVHGPDTGHSPHCQANRTDDGTGAGSAGMGSTKDGCTDPDCSAGPGGLVAVGTRTAPARSGAPTSTTTGPGPKVAPTATTCAACAAGTID